MTAFICTTCGTQFPPALNAPAECPICTDSRQYVGLDGQQWTTLDELRRSHQNVIHQEEPGLLSIYTQPAFAIGERAFLVQTPAGNVLWDCVTLLDLAACKAIERCGGLSAIAISHPHYYTTMIEWSIYFDDAPIYLHEADRKWVMRPHRNVHFWSGESMEVLPGLMLLNTPGHFDGYQVLHWPAGAAGRGALLAGDQPQVCLDPRWVSFMYSYPNYIPLGPRAVLTIETRLLPYAFERIYGAFPQRTVASDAKAVVQRSVARYMSAISP